MRKVRAGYTFEGAYNTRKEAVNAAGRHAYQIISERHGQKTVYYLYILK